MKPDWKDAPEWANWLAMDKNGDWYWFENEPFSLISVWDSDKGKAQYAGTSGIFWEETKEKRQ